MSTNKTSLLKLYPGAVKRAADINPLVSSLIGAGLGAGAGAGYTYATEKDPVARKKKMKTALMAGALGGGTLGAAASLLGGPVKRTVVGDVPKLPKDEGEYTSPLGRVSPVIAGAGWGTLKGMPALKRRLADNAALKNLTRTSAAEEAGRMALTPLQQAEHVEQTMRGLKLPSASREGLQAAGKAFLPAYLGTSAVSGMISPDLIKDMADTQWRGDARNITADALLNPVSSYIAGIRNLERMRFGDPKNPDNWANTAYKPVRWTASLGLALPRLLARYGAGVDF